MEIRDLRRVKLGRHGRTKADIGIFAHADSVAVVALHVARINVEVDLPAIPQVAILCALFVSPVNPKPLQNPI